MQFQYKSSHLITRLIYGLKMKEQRERLEEAKNPEIIYVTDLVACTHKYHLRLMFPELTMKFEPSAILGDLVHAGLEKYLEKEGFEVEVPIEKKISVKGREYIVKGRVDAYKPSEELVIEIKSGRTSQNLPREHHVYQLKIYLDLLDANKGILIYVTPEKILEYEINRSKDIDVKSLIKSIVEDNVHPKWSWECKYCVFQKICPYYRRTEQF